MSPTVLHYITYIIPLLSVGVHLLLSPQIKPLWMSLPGKWPQIVGALTSLVGTMLAAQASGDTWNVSFLKGLTGLATTGLLGHGLTQMMPAPAPAPTPEKPAAQV